MIGDGREYPPSLLIILVKRLPLESATKAAIRGGEQFEGWGLDRYLWASILDAIQHNTYAFIAANSERKPKQPEPFPRPQKKRTSEQKAKNPFSQIAAERIAAIRKAKAQGG